MFIQNMTLKKAYLTTDSATRKVYHVMINGLFATETISNITEKYIIPIFVGTNTTEIKLSPHPSFKTNYEYTILDEAGTPTTDAVSIDLFFEMN